MKELFNKLIEEACNGRVVIDNEEWNYSFNTIIFDNSKEIKRLENNNNKNTLIIENEDSFYKLLNDYIELELSMNRKTLYIINKDDKVKFLIVNLFANATTEDFLNPENFIKRNIKFLKDQTFDYLDNSLTIDIGSSIKDSNLVIKREMNSTMMETPYKMKFSLTNGEDIYELPSIYYGIIEENGQKKCYVYGIQASKNNELSNKYNKKINRLLYKINDGVEDSKEYYDYKNGISDYYPENNISDVTMSFVLSLNFFISLLQQENISEIKAVPYLPVRYNSRELAAIRSNKEELNNRNCQIQKNLTEKFIRTFRRLEHQNRNIEITLFPYEIDEFLTIKVKPNKEIIDNEFLEETSKRIKV